MKLPRKIILLLAFIAGILPLAIAVTDSAIAKRIPTKETIEEYKKDSEFNYEKVLHEDYSWWEAIKQWIKDLLESIFDFPEVQSNEYWDAIMWTLIVLAVLGIIYFIFKKEITALFGKRNTKNLETLKTDFVDLSEGIPTIEARLQQAIDEKNYAEAVRLYYTLALKNLIDAELIVFTIDKTNNEYLLELPQGAIRQPFKQLTFYFDYIFYGEFEANERIFLKAKQEYEALLSHLKNSTVK